MEGGVVGNLNGPSSAVRSRFLLEILEWNLTWRSRRANAQKIERKGDRGMVCRFPRKFSVRPELEEVEG